MANERKYYWLKLKRDFFKRHNIRIIEEMPNGKEYVLFYLKMLVESIDHDGELRFNETIPYNEQMLSVITNTNIDIVRHAMKLFIELKMIDLFDDETIYMSEVQKMIGNETEGAERVRKHREKINGINENKRLLHCNADVTKCNTEKETEKEIDTEKIVSCTTKQQRFKAPSADEVRIYCSERKNTVDPDKFIDYYTANGWKVGKNAMKDWKAAIRTWEKNKAFDQKQTSKKVSFQDYDGSNQPIAQYTGIDLLAEAREL